SGLGEVVEIMMAKDRKKRYRTPDDLIIDLECLLVGDPPKLARQRIEASTLEELAAGEAEEEEESSYRAGPGVSPLWVIVLGSLLAASLAVNLLALLRRS